MKSFRASPRGYCRNSPRRIIAFVTLLLAVGIYHAADASESPNAAKRVVEVDFSQVVGTIRPLHGVNCGPIAERFTLDLSRYFRALQIPCVRLHSPNYPGIDCVHIEHVFPDLTADPDNPANYDFRRTDDYIAAVLAVGAKPIYNLGHGNDKHVLAGDYQRINIPPADPQKWARICVNIVRHYNEGWANGFHHNLQYWEIWNEPDAQVFWDGTVEQLAELYVISATALKEHDPNLKVGGPAISYSLKFLERFLAICRERKAPLDFCSWHCYAERPVNVFKKAADVQHLLEKYGFAKTENQLNEWSPCPFNFLEMRRNPLAARRFFERTGGSEGAAFAAAVLCFLQDSPVTTAAFYSGDTLRWGFIDRNGAPKATYFAFLAFRQMLDTPRRVLARGDDLETGFAVLAGLSADNSQAGILISNHQLKCNEYEVHVRGLPWREGTISTRYLLDQHSSIDRYGLEAVATNHFPAGDSIQFTTPATDKSVCLLELAGAGSSVAAPDKAQGQINKPGADVKIKLHEPVVVSKAPEGLREWGPWQFPSIWRGADGRLMVSYSIRQDSAREYGASPGLAFSKNEGRSWQAVKADETKAFETSKFIQLPNGDVLRQVILPSVKLESVRDKLPPPVLEMTNAPYNLKYFKADGFPDELAGYRFARRKAGSSEWLEEYAVVHVPGQLRRISEGVLIFPWFDRIVLAPDNTLWGANYRVRIVDGKVQKNCAVNLLRSVDNGRTWNFIGEIVYQPDKATDPNTPEQGDFYEPNVAFLPDKSMLCLMRTTQLDKPLPLYSSRSTDGGKTWSRPKIFDDCGVWPALLTLKNGVTLASYGRPGLYVRATRDPSGANWGKRVTVVEPGNWGGDTCSYSDLIALSDHEAIIVYSDFNCPDEEGRPRKTILAQRISIE
jgi:xylan 1,4-beta-xylosidase